MINMTLIYGKILGDFGHHFHANDILKYTHLFGREMLIGKLLCAMHYI